jgi:site-specific DNA recombinase
MATPRTPRTTPSAARRPVGRGGRGTSKRRTPPSLFGAGADRRMRVVWYRRASTDESNQPYSLDAQESRLRAYTAAQPGWEFVDDYVERASAKDVEGRPQLQRLLDDAANGRFDLVLVARLDRWSRNLIDCLDTVDFLTENEVAFHSASEHFDTSTPTGVLLLQMLGMFAQFERSTIIDRIQRGNQAKIDKGLPLTGRLGYGLRVDGNGKVEAHPDTIGVVRRIFDEYVNLQYGTRTIVAGLNEDGIPGSGTAPWSPDAVIRILRNRGFVGEVRHQDAWHPGAHDPIVDTAQFEAAQELLTQRATPAAAASTGRDFVLTGTITCGRCGGAYVGSSGTGAAGRVHRYYSCVTARRYGAKKCAGPSLPAGELEDLVITALLDTYADHDLFSQAIEMHLARQAKQQDTVAEQLQAQRTLITDRERVLARYRRDYEDEKLSADRYEARASQLEDELAGMRVHEADLELALTAEQPQLPEAADLHQLHQLLRERMRTGNTDARKGVCNALIESLVVHDRDDIHPTFRLLPPTETVEALEAEDVAAEPAAAVTVGGSAASTSAFARGGPGWSQGDSNP